MKDDKKKFGVMLEDNEERFCQLYVNGNPKFRKNAVACYNYLYGDDGTDELMEADARYKANCLLNEERIKKRIEQLESLNKVECGTLRERITSMMMKVMDECANDVYSDRRGIPIAPAAMRSVSVSAAKLVSDINGLREETIQKIQVGTDGDNGLVFNLVVPEKRKGDKEV